ncbi:MAG: beta-galactosidase, partial [Herbiconiux sp.]|nr:beta-galactosidase [Herbiconiux sp.]
MLYGASYYAEYQPTRRVAHDLGLMVQAGFTVIRLGESTWASYEPAEGEISFEALAEVVDTAHELGLAVVLGTPSYAVPSWLARQYPEVMAETADGRVLPYGARQNLDFTNPVYRRHVERIVRAMVARFGDHPAV